jgi:hypothetical protein|tara:strand:+ start:311 stop:787 length:477 start_codon:yes stop_codon:yes gene_type:complete
MKKMTQDDIDAGLTQADVDLGMRGSVIKGGSDAAMRAKIKAEKEDNTSIVDQYRDYSKNPAAKAMPVKEPRAIKGEDLAEASEPRSRTSNEKIGSMLERLGGGNRVGMIPPKIDSFGSTPGAKKGGAVKKMAKGGSVSSASKRADGCAVKGKTRGKMM